MSIQIRWSSFVCVGALAVAAISGAQSWSRIAASGGPNRANIPLLLTDGSVMVQDYGTVDWYRLVPNSKGSYVNGTWKKAASTPANYAPLFFASAVLKDGRMVVMGGEYNFLQGPIWTNLGAIYDPVQDKWTAMSAPNGWNNIGDAQCVVLPDGTMVMAMPFDQRMASLDPTTLTWTALSNVGKADRNDEEGWTLMPDGTILAPDAEAAPGTERYLPTIGQWISAGAAPGLLTDAGSEEIGPLVLLPTGKVVAIGAIGHNDLYTPGTNLMDQGSWAKLPDLPTMGGGQLGLADAPAVLLPNGHVLFGASPGIFGNPTFFFEFDGVGAFNPAPTPLNGGSNSCFQGNFLMLPTGQAMYTNNSSDIEVYTETGTFQSSWRPSVTSVPSVLVLGKTAQVRGRQLNGMSQASSYGDDSTNATNYPLVRLTYKTGTKDVVYFRTFGHSSMGVQTGSLIVTTNFSIPLTAKTGTATLEVVANGIPSVPVNVTVSKDSLKPDSVGMFEGSSSSGNVASVQLSDDNYFSVNSTLMAGLGQVASAYATFTIPGGSASLLDFTFETNTSYPVQALYFAFNYSTGKYVNFGSASQGAGDKITEFQVPNAAPYIGPGGVCKVMVRAVNPSRANRDAPPTTLRVDQFTLTPG